MFGCMCIMFVHACIFTQINTMHVHNYKSMYIYSSTLTLPTVHNSYVRTYTDNERQFECS